MAKPPVEGAPEGPVLAGGDAPAAGTGQEVSETEIQAVIDAAEQEAANAGGPGDDQRVSPADRLRRAWARFHGLVRRNPLFTVILVIAAALRGIAMVGYRPAMFFNDSFDYLHVAMSPYPHQLRPDGYSFFLWILKPFHSFALVVGVQHLMGLGMGVMVYALLRHRFRLPGWGATLAAVPVLLDAYQIQLEQLVLSDVQFTFLTMAAVTLLLWKDRPSWRVAALIGLVIGISWLTRSVGLPVLLGVLGYMVVRWMNWRVLAATIVACALPVVAYMSWYKAEEGKFAITDSNGFFLFARVYKFADCHKIKNLPVEEMILCTEKDGTRLPNSQDGIWNEASPLNRYTGTRWDPEKNRLGNDYAKRVILAQPGDYAQTVWHDFFRVFDWKRTVFPDKSTYSQYEFGTKARPNPTWPMGSGASAAEEADAYERGSASTRLTHPFADVIRVYQDHVYLRGTLLGVLLVVSLGGMVPLWRRFGGPALLPWTLAIGLLLAPAATAEFDYRYVLPAVPLAGLATGIAFTADVRAKYARLFTRRKKKPETPAPA
ncbi:phospholipid carrier-dependent glycosyltransferase [Actinomadura oligospora]|uniref:phospholipid carrier-dependent glycosyltransferase n=1 Tax=Actinomadura oligospora TaxID=111804 RepID=UPI0004B5E254|nr:phospholipid carrier-dependent glycosyltransferase [Actinomadura oligospora]